MKVANWGNYPVVECELSSFLDEQRLGEIVFNSKTTIARGLGRCYGDSSLNEKVVSTLKFNRFISFDESDGVLTCESGVSLSEILDIFVSKGWFLSVTPGTKFVTVGGAIASNVHGKNHHKDGSFCDQLLWMDIMVADGSVIRASRQQNQELFAATAGGMGLTGIVLRAAIGLKRIKSAFINEEVVVGKNLDEIMQLFENSKNYTYSVAWIDCLQSQKSLGRSVLMCGEHAKEDDVDSEYPLRSAAKKSKNIPFNFPDSALNTLSVKIFNELYYQKAPKEKTQRTSHYESFFYPLDAVLNWNRIYGKRGFTQYQFVLPKESANEGLKKILLKIAQSGQGSFLAVLKLFGKESGEYLTFPKEGYTLALDFALKPQLFPLLNELDAMVTDYDGRFYLAKDARISKAAFQKGYPQIDEFLKIKAAYDPSGKFSSLQSRRVGL